MEKIKGIIQASIDVKQQVLKDEIMLPNIATIGELQVDILQKGNRK